MKHAVIPMVAGMTRKEYHALPRNKQKREEYRRAHPEKFKQYTMKYRMNNPEKFIFRAARQRAKNKGIDFCIDLTDITIPERCPILDIPIICGSGNGTPGGKMNSPSLDRIDNTKGYIKGNVQVISHQANSMKFTASKDELLTFAKWVLKTYDD